MKHDKTYNPVDSTTWCDANNKAGCIVAAILNEKEDNFLSGVYRNKIKIHRCAQNKSN